MSQELDPLNPDSSKAVAKAVEDIEVSLDFKPYLEAVQKGSDRTRSTVYVLLTMVAIAFTSYRSTSNPDWLDLRLTKLQLASACVKDKSGGDLVKNDGSLFSPECWDSISYTKAFLFSGNQNELLLKKEFTTELNDQIQALMKVRTEALSLRLPFFGTAMDVNDVGLITGAFMAFILYILYVGIDREIYNLDRAMIRAKEGPKDKRGENLELLLITQVLAMKKGPTYAVHAILLAAVIIHFMILKNDVVTTWVATQLEGRFWGLLETFFDGLFFFLVLIAFFLVSNKQWKLDKKVDELGRALKLEATPALSGAAA